MEKGSSMPWSEVLYEATGETRLDGTALREYFLPLEEWLRNENLRTQEYVGWNYGRRQTLTLPLWFIVIRTDLLRSLN